MHDSLVRRQLNRAAFNAPSGSFECSLRRLGRYTTRWTYKSVSKGSFATRQFGLLLSRLEPVGRNSYHETEQMKRYGIWVLGILSLAAGIIHPTPWCIGCETTAPFGHVYTRLDDVLQIWLVIVPLLAGLLKLDKSWLAPLLMVAVQLMEQFVGGEPWLDFKGSEGPFIFLSGLPVCVLSLLVGYGCRYCYDSVRPRLAATR